MQTIYDDPNSSDFLKTWPKVLDDMKRFGLVSLLLIILMPILTCHGAIVVAPLTFISISGMYIAALVYAVPARDELLLFIDSS